MVIKQYKPPSILFNRHLETIYPSVFRKVSMQRPVRERISTPDDDFLDIDIYSQKSDRCVIINHGLEGDSQRPYVVGMAKIFLMHDFDVMAWNFRGCSGELNKQLRFYHSGATEDLKTVIEFAAKRYDKIYIIGFSLGGNLLLKYLGEQKTHPSVKRAVAISVPLNLHGSCLEISKPHNWIYARRFLLSLKEKVKSKAAVRNDLNVDHLESVKTLLEFDDRFTGPLHGFRNAIEYYTQCSSLYFLENIKIPTLVVNAVNDPFLSADCFPSEGFGNRTNVTLEYPDRGGHVGFALFDQKGLYWSELRALSFIESEV